MYVGTGKTWTDFLSIAQRKERVMKKIVPLFLSIV
jgi:hypothetical protein